MKPVNSYIQAKNYANKKASEIVDGVYSANVYDPSIQTANTITDNAVIQNGVIVTGQNNFLTTGKIYLKGNQQYILSHKIWWDASATSQGAMFDKNDTYLGNINATTFVTAPGTSYIRLSSQKSALFSLSWLNSNFMISEGTSVPGSYVAYQKTRSIENMRPLFVTVSNDIVSVVSKYNDTQDMVVTLKKRGANNLIDFHTWGLIANSSSYVSSAISKATTLYTNITDFIGPYMVKAINTIDGDLPSSSDFTGGNHEYTNTGSGGTPTARNIAYEVYVDGRKVGTSYSGYANFIDIKWKNRVQATNTKKSDGTGREVLEERVHLRFDGSKWTIESRITALEDFRIEKYYGVQLSNMWGSNVIFKGDTVDKQVSSTSDSFPSGTKCLAVVNVGTTHSAEAGLEPTYGLSNLTLNGLGASAMTSSAGKSYMVLIYNNTTNNLTSGNMYHYRGYFRFFPTF